MLLLGSSVPLPSLSLYTDSSRKSWFRILTHRTRSPEDPSTPSRDSSHQVAMTASNQMVRIVEDLLASNSIQQCPIHIIPSLFAAMCMQAVNIQSGDAVLQQLASVKLKLCMIALRELQSSWPVSGWIFLLFTKIMHRIRDQDEGPAKEGPTSRLSTLADVSTRPIHETVQPLESSSYIPGSVIESNDLQQATTFSRTPAYQPSHISGYVPWDAQSLSVPLNFSTDWSTVRDEDLWLIQDFDFIGNMPRMDHQTSYMNGPHIP